MCLGIPGMILSIDATDTTLRMAKVRFGGIVKEVSLALTPEANVGDYVIVHAGVAISVVDEEEANKIISEIGELESPKEFTDRF
ncbi:MAG: HypC/HybG/HupF family hydrogenase formation chaperone [Candidatus Hydrogenedentes bacterium]|nr:HypC/HybG/HupF family hydrogenase formation chaperone [Candidatus Hydrogenedentota bacterium]